MELINERVNVNETISKGNTQTTVEGDIIVPDTKPDILKILQVDAIACVTHKSIENGRVTTNGRVDFKILYIPDKEGERIKSILTSFDFSQPIDCGKTLDDMLIAASANAEKVDFSLINSRKLRIKAITEIDYEVCAPKTLEIAVDVSGSDSAELCKEPLKLQNAVDFCEHEIFLKESLEVPNGQASICELLKADAKITDAEYKTVTGKIVVKGAVCVSLLYCDDNGKIEFVEEEIPFTEVLDCDDAAESSVCDIDYFITDMNCSVEEDSDGDNRLVSIDMTITAQVKATECIELEMISDCYEPYMRTELSREEVNLEEIVSRVNAQNTIREMIDTGADAPEVSSVYNVIAKPCVTKAELQKNKLMCEGRIEAYILYVSDSSENPVYSIKKEIPFSYMIDCDADEEGLVPEIKAEVRHTGYNLNAAGEIELRCILGINANIVKNRVINVINAVTTEEIAGSDKKGIVIYFVQKGDSLWSIAKNYCVPREAVLSFNNIKEEDNLKQGSRLFIPN